MDFKEWLKLSEINKGLQRSFGQQFPHLPDYVQRQVLFNRVSPMWRRTQAAMQPTASPSGHVYSGAETTTTHPELQSLYRDRRVQSIANFQNWKKEVVTLHPTDFTPTTMDQFLAHQFGSSSIMNNAVRDHRNRTMQQNALARERGEHNEPIVMVRVGDKYEMQEGWHRLYAYFMQFSAPQEEQQKVLRGYTQMLDFSKWKPIRISAWIGDNPKAPYESP